MIAINLESRSSKFARMAFSNEGEAFSSLSLAANKKFGFKISFIPSK